MSSYNTKVDVSLFLDDTNVKFLNKNNEHFDGKDLLSDLDFSLRHVGKDFRLHWDVEIVGGSYSFSINPTVNLKQVLCELIFNGYECLPKDMLHEIDGVTDAMSAVIEISNIEINSGELDDLFRSEIFPKSLELHITDMTQTTKTDLKLVAHAVVNF